MGKRRGRHVEKGLSAISIRKLGPGKHADGGGLYLLVEPSGARRWILRVVVHRGDTTVRPDIGLGGIGTVSLADAREKARELRKIAREGGDPLASRIKRAIPTFQRAAQQCFDVHAPNFHNQKHIKQWMASLKQHVFEKFPKIAEMPVDQIGTNEVMTCLEPIWLKLPVTARRIRQRIGTTLDWAKARGFREVGSPTKELSRVLPKQKRQPRHHPAMPYADIPRFLRQLQEGNATPAVKAGLELLILTCARTSEVLKATWSEIDFENKIWVIPGARMKMRQEHAIPLAPRALELFKQLNQTRRKGGELVFEVKRGKSLSNMVFLSLMRRLGLSSVPHGFRSGFRDWASERTDFPREIVEKALAHLVEDRVERAYLRSQLLDRRRQLAELWADHCAGRVGDIGVRRAAAE